MGGKRPGAGRKKGSHNKLTTELKDMVLQALEKSGGVKYLQQQAKDSPVAFLTLLGKVLPLQVKGSGENGEHVFELKAPWLKEFVQHRGMD